MLLYYDGIDEDDDDDDDEDDEDNDDDDDDESCFENKNSLSTKTVEAKKIIFVVVGAWSLYCYRTDGSYGQGTLQVGHHGMCHSFWQCVTP